MFCSYFILILLLFGGGLRIVAVCEVFFSGGCAKTGHGICLAKALGIVLGMIFTLVALAEALDETNRRADEVEFLAQFVLQEALVTKVQRLFLVGENQECGRRRLGLRHVVDAHGTRLRCGA